MVVAPPFFCYNAGLRPRRASPWWWHPVLRKRRGVPYGTPLPISIPHVDCASSFNGAWLTPGEVDASRPCYAYRMTGSRRTGYISAWVAPELSRELSKLGRARKVPRSVLLREGLVLLLRQARRHPGVRIGKQGRIIGIDIAIACLYPMPVCDLPGCEEDLCSCHPE